MVSGGYIGPDQLVFGGRSGTPGNYNYSARFSELFRDHTQKQVPDYPFSWQAPTQSSQKPDARAFHAAVLVADTAMVVFDGVRQGEVVDSTVWFGRFQNAIWRWTPITLTSTDNPGPRYAQEAVYDASLKRIFVFGGSSSYGAAPTDSVVWSLDTSTMESGTARWARCAADAPRPSARVQHSLTPGGYVRKNGTEGFRSRAFLYGGRTTWNSGARLDDLWTVWFTDSTHVQWKTQAPVTNWPGKRARHGAAFYGPAQQVVLMGGDLDGLSVPDSAVWVGSAYACGSCDHDTVTVRFTPGKPMVRGRAGLRASMFLEDDFVRVPEIFNPAVAPGSQSQWSTLSNAILFQDWYPFSWSLPSSVAPSARSVFVAGPDSVSWLLDLNAGTPTWTPWPAGGSSTFGRNGGSAVMYRPG